MILGTNAATLRSSYMLYQFRPSVCLSVTRVDCGHTVRPIETILVSLESPNILISEKIRMVYIGHPKPFQILGRMGSGSDRTHCAPPFPVYDMHYVDPLAGLWRHIGRKWQQAVPSSAAFWIILRWHVGAPAWQHYGGLRVQQPKSDQVVLGVRPTDSFAGISCINVKVASSKYFDIVMITDQSCIWTGSLF